MVGSTRPPFPSAPSEPSLRRLGVSGPGGGDRPIKAQLIVALVALIILLAVPLYLWRRPSLRSSVADAGAPSATPLASGPTPVASVAPAVPLQPQRVRTTPLQRVRCGASRGKATSGGTCDALPAIEHALVEAVQQSFDCAPKASKEGTINHVLEVDFVHKTLHVFPGKSGDWHGPSARRTTKCVERVLGKPDLSQIPHTHAYYALAVMATYAPQGALVPMPAPASAPGFPAPNAMSSSALASPTPSLQPPTTQAPLPQ